jgi:hypothetical protein
VILIGLHVGAAAMAAGVGGIDSPDGNSGFQLGNGLPQAGDLRLLGGNLFA